MSEEDQDAYLKKALQEANELRKSVHHDGMPTEGPADLHDQLLRHRKAMDRLEEHLAVVGRVRAGVDRMVSAAQDVLDDAEAQATQLKEEYSTALEKNSHIRLQTLDQRIVLRKAVRRRSEVVEVHEFIKVMHRGVDASRRDLDSRIRLITLQGSLEK